MPATEAGRIRHQDLSLDAPAGAREARVPPAPGSAPALPHAELADVLRPMLGTLCAMSGAAAATVSTLADDGSAMEAVVAVGLAGMTPEAAARPLEQWCDACAGPRTPTSACMRSAPDGGGPDAPVEFLGPVCEHIVAVPLRHRSRPVGTLNLMFESERTLPPEMAPLLQAVGDLLGVTLDNARLARENLRISLTNERHLMANEVHDSLAQGLTYMRMRMSLLRDAIRRNDALRAMKYWGDVDEALGNSQRRLRELITYFRSRMDPHGLLHALTEISHGFPERTGIALTFVNDARELCLPPEYEIEVFHIVQEALANICRHAHARSARLSIARRDGVCMVVVEDDGVGIGAYPQAPGQDSGHYGVAIMKERAHRLGGTLSIEPGNPGTRLELRFPEELTHAEVPT